MIEGDICNYCRESGHWKRDCPKKANKDFLAAIVHNGSSSESYLVLAIGKQLHQHFEQCVLDSGCSYHICPHRDWFMTHEKKYGGNILMGNDASCMSISIGSVQINMHDSVFRTLTEVHHIPELKKNLFSMGVIASKGFSCWVEGRVMQIRGKKKFVIM